MSEINEQPYQDLCYYVAYRNVPDYDGVKLGKALATRLASNSRKPLIVLAAQKQNVSHHPELSGLQVVTERVGHIQDGKSVVLALCPSYKAMDKLNGLSHTTTVLVDWPGTDFSAWAKLANAVDIESGMRLSTGMPESAQSLLVRIDEEGYNGWSDDISRKLTVAHLKSLDDLGHYDPDILLEYVRGKSGSHRLSALKRILTKFEASRI